MLCCQDTPQRKFSSFEKNSRFRGKTYKNKPLLCSFREGMKMQIPIDIERIKQGDEKAFASFFIFFYPKLMALAYRFVDEYAAEDLVQEVFALYWERKETIQVEHLQSFLYKWLQNKCLDYLKHRKVVNDYEAEVRLAEMRIAFLTESADSNEVLKQIVSHDLRNLLEEIIGKLPAKCAEILRLCYLHDLSHKEIADIMQISVRTVEGHIRQGLIYLRAYLQNTAIYILYATFFLFH